MKPIVWLLLVGLPVVTACSKASTNEQSARQQGAAKATPSTRDTLTPLTKLEAFKPAAGTVFTLGYNEMGSVEYIGRVSVDARELRDQKGDSARGVLIEVTESQYRKERTFIDQEELPELLRGFDALLGIEANPTKFRNFETHYNTKGEFQIGAFNNSANQIQFAVKAGRIVAANAYLKEPDMRKLRTIIEAAEAALQQTAPSPATSR